MELAVKSLVAQKCVRLAKWLYRQVVTTLSGGTKVSHQGFLEYILALGKIYQGSNRARRGQLLRDAQEITGKSQRTVLRHLGESSESIQKRIAEGQPIEPGRGRKKKYQDDELLPHSCQDTLDPYGEDFLDPYESRTSRMVEVLYF